MIRMQEEEYEILSTPNFPQLVYSFWLFFRHGINICKIMSLASQYKSIVHLVKQITFTIGVVVITLDRTKLHNW